MPNSPEQSAVVQTSQRTALEKAAQVYESALRLEYRFIGAGSLALGLAFAQELLHIYFFQEFLVKCGLGILVFALFINMERSERELEYQRLKELFPEDVSSVQTTVKSPE